MTAVPGGPEPAPPGASGFALLIASPDRTVLERSKSILEAHGIPAMLEVESLSTLYGGLLDLALTRGGPRLKVPRSRLEDAKRILCEQGIRCEVPVEAMERVLERVFEPALRGEPFDEDRALRLLEGQTADACRFLCSRLAGKERGPVLLARLLLGSLRTDGGGEEVRRDLSHALEEAGVEDLAEILGRVLGTSPDAAVRRRLARTLGRLPRPQAAQLLAGLLGDPDVAVRGEAFESLYFLSEGKSFSYEPDAPPGSREPAAARWRGWAASWKGPARKKGILLAGILPPFGA